MSRCDDERVALYVNQDLGGAEALEVAEHIETCARCRDLAGALQADAKRVARLIEATEGPSLVRTVRASQRWGRLPAAAAALLVALLLGVAARPVLAGGVRQAFHWLTVQRLNPQQMSAYLDDLNQKAAPGTGQQGNRQGVSVNPLLVTTDAEEAAKAAGFQALVPSYIPEGYALKEIWVWPSVPDHGQRGMQQVYESKGSRNTLTIAHAPVSGNAGTVTAPAGKSEEVTVGDGKGLVVHGFMKQDSGSSWQWADGAVTLRFYHNGEAVRITAMAPDFPVDELVRVAESIP